MTTTSIILAIVLVVSVLANFVLGWYVNEMIKYVNLTNQDMETFGTGINEYQSHLETVYELPTFYGDETLKGLLQHTKDVNLNIKEFIELNNETLGNNNG